MSQSLKAFHLAWLRFITKRHFRWSSLFSMDYLKCYGFWFCFWLSIIWFWFWLLRIFPNLWFTLCFWSTCKPIWLLCKILHQGVFFICSQDFFYCLEIRNWISISDPELNSDRVLLYIYIQCIIKGWTSKFHD